MATERGESVPSPLRIAIVTPFASPERGAAVQRVESFAREWKKFGHSVTVFAPSRAGVTQTDDIVRYGRKRELFRLIRHGGFDVVVGTSPPMTHSFMAMVAARLSGAKTILDVRDPWTHAAAVIGTYPKHSPKLRLYREMEKMAYREADRIFCVTEKLEKQAEKDGAPTGRVFVVPNGASTERFFFDPATRERVRKELGYAKGDVVAVYAGSFEGWDVEEMIAQTGQSNNGAKETVEMIDKGHVGLRATDVRLLFVVPDGPGEKGIAHLREVLEKNGFANQSRVINSMRGESDRMAEYLCAADVGIVTIPDELTYCVRAKTYDYAASGLVIVAKGPKGGATDLLMGKYGKSGHSLGYFCPSWDRFADGLIYAAVGILQGDQMRAERARWAAGEFNRDAIARKALLHIHEVVKK